MAEPLKKLRFALLVVLVLIGLGTIGFHYLEGMTLLDAAYTTVIILTTLGIELVKPLSREGKVFTMVLSLSGVFIIFTVVFSAIINAVELAASVTMQHVIWRRRMERLIRGIKDHYIICGYGRMGQAIAAELSASNVPFVVVEDNPEQLPKLIESKMLFVEGDASDEKILIAAGIDRARGLIAVAPSDADNTFIVLTAKGTNPKLFVVARSIKAEDEAKLRRAGADRVMSPYILGGKRMAWAVLHPNVVDFMESAVCGENLEFEITELVVDDGFKLIGKTLGESEIRERSGATVMAVKRASGKLIVSPSPDTMLEKMDVLVLVGTPKQMEALQKLAYA
ncbi:MAG: potassium channel family protein [Armatimonadota bacterium]